MDALFKKVQNIAAAAAEEASGRSSSDSTGSGGAPPRPPPPRPAVPQQDNSNRSINLKTATREELVAFIKDYSAYTRQIESRCKKLHEAHTTVSNERASLQAQYEALSQQNIEQSQAFSSQLKEVEDDAQRITKGCLDVAAALDDDAQTIKSAPPESAVIQAAEMMEKYAKMLRELTQSQKIVQVPNASLKFYAPMLNALDALREANETNRRAVLDLRNYTAKIPTNQGAAAKKGDGSGLEENGKQPAALPADIELFRVKEENEVLRRARDQLQTQINKMTEDTAKMMKKQHELEQQNASLISAIEQQSTDAEEQKTLTSAIDVSPVVSASTPSTATAPAVDDSVNQATLQKQEERRKALEAELEKSHAETDKLKVKITKLQQLLQKAKEQFDIKSNALLESASQIAKLTNEVSSLRSAADDLHAKLDAEIDAREQAENSIRTMRHDSVLEREGLESRARAAESELAQVQEEFRVYKERARAAMIMDSSSSPTESKQESIPSPTNVESQQSSYDALDFLQLRSENEKLQQELALARGKLNSLQQEYNAFKEDSVKRDAETASKVSILQEEKNALEVQNKRALSELEAEYTLKYEELRRALIEHRESSKKLLDDKDTAIAALQNQIVQLNHSLAEAKPRSPVTIVRQADDGSESRQSVPSQSSQQQSQAQQQPQQQQPSTTQPQQPQQVLFHVANMQARRESELVELKKRVSILEEENAELAKTVELHEIQEKELKTQIRDLDRSKSRETVNIEYLKNIIVKFIETDDYEHLMPVITMLLRLTPEEVSHAQQARQERTAAASSRGFLSFLPVSPKK